MTAIPPPIRPFHKGPPPVRARYDFGVLHRIDLPLPPKASPALAGIPTIFFILLFFLIFSHQKQHQPAQTQPAAKVQVEK